MHTAYFDIVLWFSHGILKHLCVGAFHIDQALGKSVAHGSPLPFICIDLQYEHALNTVTSLLMCLITRTPDKTL